MKDMLDLGMRLKYNNILSFYTPIRMISARLFTYRVGNISDTREKLFLINKILLNNYISVDEHWVGLKQYRRTFYGKIVDVIYKKERVALIFEDGRSIFISGDKNRGTVNSNRYFIIYDDEESFSSDALLFELELEEYKETPSSRVFIFPEYII